MPELEKVPVDMKLEVVVLGVSDAPRRKGLWRKAPVIGQLFSR